MLKNINLKTYLNYDKEDTRLEKREIFDSKGRTLLVNLPTIVRRMVMLKCKQGKKEWSNS